MERRPDWYMFREHSKEVVISWARQLQYFYFCRAWGGHANDGDAFKAGIMYSDRADLINKLNLLGIIPGAITAHDPQPVPGQPYPATEYAKFKSPVSRFPDIEQPLHVTINGQKTFVWVTHNTITFSVAGTADGNIYNVSDVDFSACLKLEAIFNQLHWHPHKDTTLEQNNSCISPSSYPEFY